MPIAAVSTCLDLDEDNVLVLIQERSLAWAFDIRGPGATQRRAIRVLSESVIDLVEKRKRPHLDTAEEWARVAGLIFPKKATIVTSELARALNCSRWGVILMIRARHFRLAAGSQIRRGPFGSPHIITASAAAWLKRRVVS